METNQECDRLRAQLDQEGAHRQELERIVCTHTLHTMYIDYIQCT